jgi:hypothetical protein
MNKLIFLTFFVLTAHCRLLKIKQTHLLCI